MDLVGHRLAFDQPNFFLPAELSDDFSDIAPNLSIQCLSAILRQDHNMVLALLLDVGLTLQILHNGSLCIRSLPQERTVYHKSAIAGSAEPVD